MVGPNGAGKSTLLKSISGLIHPYSGADPVRRARSVGPAVVSHRPRGISYVPEGGRLFPNMTVRENLLMGAFATPENLKTGLLKEIYTLFPILEKRGRQFAATLSGGEKQMLAISRGLVSSPKLLMLDEPSLGIAPKLVEEIYERLQALKQKGLTVLLVEQNTHLRTGAGGPGLCAGEREGSRSKDTGRKWRRIRESENIFWGCEPKLPLEEGALDSKFDL